MKKIKMTKDELRVILERNRNESLGVEDGDLSNERASALDHYHGRPYGNEKEGRSQVVSRDLSETVEWIMPALMNIFLNSGNICEFSPVSEDDEDLAQQESDYVNHVVMQENDGFITLYDGIKDTLILKNGYFKHYWDQSEEIRDEEYAGLTGNQLVQLLMDLDKKYDEVEVVEQAETDNGKEPIFDIKLRCKHINSRVRIEAVPAEEMRISRSARGSLQDAAYSEHATTKTRSELLEMGMDAAFVETLPSFSEEENSDMTYSRSSVVDETDYLTGKGGDKSMNEIEYCESYIRVDWDGDGIAELRKIVTVGGEIPDGEEWNETIDAVPVTGMVMKRVPHRHVGESLDDELQDLQELKTTLERQMMDNIYATNNVQWLVNGRVNIKDFMHGLPGGIKRVKDDLPVTGAAEAVQIPSILDKILPAIDYYDKVRSYRTGVNEVSTGLDPDVLKEATKGAVLASMEKSSQKVQMIARMLAETGIKEMIRQVHALLIKHQDREKMFKLRGKWEPINPTEWRERTNLTVKVGIGTGSDEEKREKLMMLASLQERIAQLGLVGAKEAYQMFSDIAQTLGAENPSKYAMDPDSPEFQAQMQNQGEEPNPLAEMEQIKGQFKLESQKMSQEFNGQVKMIQMQADMQIQALKDSQKRESEQIKAEIQLINDEADRRSKEAIELYRGEVQAFLKGLHLDVGAPGIGGELNE